MSDYITNTTELTLIADAIRAKGETTEALVFPNGFKQAIDDIQTGGGSIGKNITLNVDNQAWQVIQVASGSISQPTNPVKSGYTFVGWSTTQGATTANVTFPYTPSADVTLYAVFNTVPQYKASPVGYGNSSPSSITFSTNSNLINWTPDEVTKDGSIFVKFPTFYRKIVATSSDQITSFIISSWKEDNNFEPYPCFVDEGGNILPYILMGKYCSTSSSTANSISGAAALMTIGAGRTLCRNKGTGYQLMDWQIFKLWQDLLCAKMQTVDTNSGSGITIDALGVAWEQNNSKVYPWVDGVNIVTANKQYVFSYKPSQYVDQATSSTTDYVTASYTYTNCTSEKEISKMGYDSTNKFFNYPSATVDNSNHNTYYCDGIYLGTSTTHPVSSDVGPAGADSGAFFCNASRSWSNPSGVRLCYRPL